MGQRYSLQLTLTYPAKLKHNPPHRRPVLPRTIRNACQYDSLGLALSSFCQHAVSAVHLHLVRVHRDNLPVLLRVENHVTLETTLCRLRLLRLFVMVIRAAINLVAAATLPTLYYPYDVSLGVRFNFFGALTYPSEACKRLNSAVSSYSQQHQLCNRGFRKRRLRSCSPSHTFG